MLHFRQKIGCILIGTGMAGKIKTIAGGKGAAASGTPPNQVDSLFFLHTNLSARFSFAFLGVLAGIIEHFIFVVAADFENGFFVGQQAGAGSLEVVIRQSIFPGAKFLFEIPGGDEIFVFEVDAAGKIEAGFGLAGAGLVDARLIAHDEGVLVLFVLEEIVDAVLFHEARDKIEVRLAVLHAIFALLKVTLQRIAEIPEAAILEDLGDDVRDGHILKDAAISSSGEKPEPRNNFGVVVSETLVHSGLREAADVAVQIAFAAIGESKRDANLLANNFGEINGGVFGKELGGDAEKPGDAFLRGKTMEQEHVLPQRGVDSNDSFVLRVSHFRRISSLAIASSNVRESSILADRNVNRGRLLAFGHAAQEITRNIREHSVGEDVVDVTGAGFDFCAALGDFGYNCGIVG